MYDNNLYACKLVTAQFPQSAFMSYESPLLKECITTFAFSVSYKTDGILTFKLLKISHGKVMFAKGKIICLKDILKTIR